MDQELRKFLKEQGGVVSVTELADLLELEEGQVRRWARENEVRRVGSTFVFGKEAAFAAADDLLGVEEEDDGDDDDSDEGDSDDDEKEADDDDDED